MSLFHPEEHRRCKRCGHEWYAEKYTRIDSQQPMLGIGITKRAQDLARQSVHEKRTRRMERYRHCPQCGSSKVKTLSKRQSKPAANSASPPPASPLTVPSGWHPDPTGRYEWRWWDGTAWTANASRGGQTVTDPLIPPPVA
jgi:hypothetical protein